MRKRWPWPLLRERSLVHKQRLLEITRMLIGLRKAWQRPLAESSWAESLPWWGGYEASDWANSTKFATKFPTKGRADARTFKMSKPQSGGPHALHAGAPTTPPVSSEKDVGHGQPLRGESLP